MRGELEINKKDRTLFYLACLLILFTVSLCGKDYLEKQKEYEKTTNTLQLSKTDNR